MIDIQRLNALHAATEPVGEYDWERAIDTAWPAVAAELTRLREFARLVRSGIEIPESEIRDEWTVASVAWLDAETKKAGE